MFSIVSRLAQLGYQVLATPGTAAALRRAGFSSEKVAKIGEKSPNVVDLIESGSVDLVINTMSGTNGNGKAGSGAAAGPVMKDGFEIRRAAVERRIPCLTSLDTAAALLESAVTAAGELEVRTITEWREGAA